MVNVPIDIFSYFLIRMDIEMLENQLDMQAYYGERDFNAFINFLKEECRKLQSLGDTKMLTLRGYYPDNPNLVFVFYGNNSGQKLPLGIIASDDMKNVIGFGNLEGFEIKASERGDM
jgi:hypothetical protein